MKTERLKSALNSGFPPATIQRLMSEVILAMAEDNMRLAHMIANDMEQFRTALARIVTLAEGMRP